MLRVSIMSRRSKSDACTLLERTVMQRRLKRLHKREKEREGRGARGKREEQSRTGKTRNCGADSAINEGSGGMCGGSRCAMQAAARHVLAKSEVKTGGGQRRTSSNTNEEKGRRFLFRPPASCAMPRRAAAGEQRAGEWKTARLGLS